MNGTIPTKRGSRETLQATDVLVANRADWMRGTLGESRPDSSKIGMKDCVRWVAKVTYLLWHRVTPEDVESILKAHGIPSTSSREFVMANDSLSEYQA